MSKRKRNKQKNQLWRGQQQALIDKVRSGAISTSDSIDALSYAMGPSPSDVAQGQTTQVAPPKPEFNLEEGDEIIMLKDDPSGWVRGYDAYNVGDRFKIFSMSKETILADGNVELLKKDFGTVYALAPQIQVPKPYSDYAAQKTEDYYDKYILD